MSGEAGADALDLLREENGGDWRRRGWWKGGRGRGWVGAGGARGALPARERGGGVDLKLGVGERMGGDRGEMELSVGWGVARGLPDEDPVVAGSRYQILDGGDRSTRWRQPEQLYQILDAGERGPAATASLPHEDAGG